MRSPTGEPREYVLKPGKTTVGRKADNDIHLPDESASRLHAEIHFNPDVQSVTVHDLNSMNGTYVNRERLIGARVLRTGDQVRIGQHVLTLTYQDTDQLRLRKNDTLSRSGTQPLTRDVILESLDQHAVLLDEIVTRLNLVFDLETAMREIADLMRQAMGADRCRVIQAERFHQLEELGFPNSIARLAIEQRSAVIIPDVEADQALGKNAMLMRVRSALCVPAMANDTVLALIYVYKTNPLNRAFDQRDLQLAVAISHQAAFALQRLQRFQVVRREQRLRTELERLMPAPEVEPLLKDFWQAEQWPVLAEQTVTLLSINLHNATQLGQAWSPQQFSEALTRYFHALTDAVFQQTGLISRYWGQGALAVFGASGKPHPSDHALQAAINLQKQVALTNATLPHPFEVGLGITHGVVLTGFLKLEERTEHLLIGEIVSEAARLAGLARPHGILVDAGTAQAAHERFALRPFDAAAAVYAVVYE